MEIYSSYIHTNLLLTNFYWSNIGYGKKAQYEEEEEEEILKNLANKAIGYDAFKEILAPWAIILTNKKKRSMPKPRPQIKNLQLEHVLMWIFQIPSHAVFL